MSEQPDRMFLRPKEVSKSTGISLFIVYGALREGELRARKLGERSWLIKPEDVEDWVERNSILNTFEVE